MKITIYPDRGAERRGRDTTYAYNGGSDGLGLHIKGCPASFTFDSAEEAYEIAGAILAGLHSEIARATGQENTDSDNTERR